MTLLPTVRCFIGAFGNTNATGKVNMAPKIDQGTIIILDIGRNVAEPEEKNEKSFFEKAKECAIRIIERKIMSQTKSYVGIILLGSKKTKNNMADQFKGLFRRIEVLAELQAPTWNMIHEFPEVPSSSRGDWVDAVIVASDHFQNGVFGETISNFKIILMTNFKSPTECSETDFEKILSGLQNEKYEVDVIGLDLENSEVVEQFKGDDVKLAQQLVTATNGVTATFDHTMSYLLFHKKRAVKAMPWNVDLEIGPNIKIPVSSYIRLKSEPILQKWVKAIKDPVTLHGSKTEAIVKSKIQVNTENQSIVDPADTIKGYHYGQRVIPFSDCDKSLLYESGDKCLSVYGFTDASNISWQNLKGDGLSYVFGRKGNQKAQFAIRCLVECLHELNLIGIVRRVYNKNNAPKMYALMPVIDTNNYICLSMAELCFEDDIKYMAFPQTNLKKYACSDEQVNAFKDLINAMDLTRAYDDNYDDSEAFPIAETVSPAAQYVMDCISFRAMNPGKPLPKPKDEIMSLFKVPVLIEKRSRDSLEKIKKLFALNKVEQKPKKVKQPVVDEQLNLPDAAPPSEPSVSSEYPDMPKIQLPKVPKSEEVNKIGTIDPIGDFTKLAARDMPLAELSLQMSEAIENLFYCNLDGNYAKPFDAMTYFRNECVKSDPSHYNNWLLKFKGALTDRKKFDIISLITAKKVNFILKSENNSSSYESEDSHEESQLYENDTVPNSTVLSIRQDVNDMFDEM